MKRYGNRHGNSGIAAYEEGPDFIRIKFMSGSVYLYTYNSDGIMERDGIGKVQVRSKAIYCLVVKR